MVMRRRSRTGAGIALDAAGVKLEIKAAGFKLEAVGFSSLKLPEKSTVS
jgi:predicted methyltransferase